MTRRLFPALMCVILLVAGCSSATTTSEPSSTTALPSTAASSDTTTSLTVADSTTTTTLALLATMVHIVEEWNSGDTNRWRATFSPDAEQAMAGSVFSVDVFTDQYEFFTTLGNQFTLLGCEAAEGDGDEVIDCTLENGTILNEYLDLDPTQVSMHIAFASDQIVSWSEHFNGANSIRSQWWEFAEWVAEADPEHGALIKPFPGTKDSADLALTYLEAYFEQ